MKLGWRPDLRAADLWDSGDRRPTVLINGLSAPPTGGALVVLQNYLRCFKLQCPQWRFIVLYGPLREDLGRGVDDSFRLLFCGARMRGLVARCLWERRWLARICEQLDCNVYFGPSGVYQPSVRIPQCLLIQDPAPYVLKRRDPRGLTRAWLLRRSWRAGVRHAACMGYTSNYMRGLVIAAAGGQAEECHLIAYNGIDQSMRDKAQRAPRPRGERKGFILSVSAFNKHKNFETLIRGLSILRKRQGFERYSLRIMGRNLGLDRYVAFLRREIARLRLEGAVTLELDCPWERLSEAYESAALFSLNSLCESFGIPALEAMAHGTPVVVGRCCAIPEVCGEAAVLVAPRDAQATANAWANVLSSESTYERLQAAGRRRCLEFSWEKSVAKWAGVIGDLLV